MIPAAQLPLIKPFQDQTNRENETRSKRRIPYKTNHRIKRLIDRNMKRATIKGRLKSSVQFKRQIQRALEN